MTTLITGSTGKTSSRLAAMFAKHDQPYLIATRRSVDTITIPALPSLGSGDITAPAVQFDWLDTSTHKKPFNAPVSQPIRAIYIVSPDQLSDSVEPVTNFIDLAASKGVKRFVMLSASVVPEGGPLYGRIHSHLKQRGDEGKLEWAVLRPTWFMNNFLESFSLDAIMKENRFYSPTQDGRIPLVHADDISASAYACLTMPTAPNRDYFILGPELLTYDEAVQILNEETGRDVKHVKIDVEGMTEIYKSAGLSPEYAKSLATLEGTIAEGKEDRTDDSVLQLTGSKGTTFREFVRQNKAVWTTA